MESLVEAASGAIGALVSTTVLYPLYTCKTKYQAENRAHQHQKYRNISDVLWEAISNGQVLSLYQGLGTKNLQSFISQFIYFYGYSFFKRLYLRQSRSKSIGTAANLVIAATAAAGACTAIATQPLDTTASRMQTSDFGKSKGLWESLSEGSWTGAFDGLGISLLLTTNPSIQKKKNWIKNQKIKYCEELATLDNEVRLSAERSQSETPRRSRSDGVPQGHLPDYVGEEMERFVVCAELLNHLIFVELLNKSAQEYGYHHKGALRILRRKTSHLQVAVNHHPFPAKLSSPTSVPDPRRCRTKKMKMCKVMIQSAKSDENEEGKTRAQSCKTVTGTVSSVWEREGILGFFKGLQAQMLKTVLTSALLLMIKEKTAKTTWVLMIALSRLMLTKGPKISPKIKSA